MGVDVLLITLKTLHSYSYARENKLVPYDDDDDDCYFIIIWRKRIEEMLHAIERCTKRSFYLRLPDVLASAVERIANRQRNRLDIVRFVVIGRLVSMYSS